MLPPSNPLDILVYELLRRSGGSKMFPDEVTPIGLKRRLTRLRATYGREPQWDHPDVHTTLVRSLARRITDFELPAVLDAWVSETQGEDRTRLVHALGRALSEDHDDAKRGSFNIPGGTPPANLLSRLIHAHGHRLDDWARAWPDAPHALVLPDGFEPWRRWVMVGARSRVAHGQALPGDPSAWTTVVRVHQAVAEPTAQTDFAWLLTQRPDLAGATHIDHPDWPVLACRLGHEPQDTVALQHLMAHPEVLQASAPLTWTKSRTYRNPWLDWSNVLSSTDREDGELPVWMIMGLRGHPDSDALSAMATPADQARFGNLRALQRVQFQSLSSSSNTEESSFQQLANEVKTAPCWTAPQSLVSSKAETLRDTHPLWEAVRREPRLLGTSYAGTPYVPGFREALMEQPHRMQAKDQAGANLWWAIAGGDRNVDAARQVLGLLAQHGVYAEPDARGRGLFFRHPNVGDVFRRGQSGKDDDLFKHYVDNPFWDSMHRHPEGFLGSTPEGQRATAEAMWRWADYSRWYKKPWDEARPEAYMLLMGFDRKVPEDHHPMMRLLVTTALAWVHKETGTSLDGVTRWAPDPKDPDVTKLMEESPFYLHVAEKSPHLTALIRAKSIQEEAPSQARARRRLRS